MKSKLLTKSSMAILVAILILAGSILAVGQSEKVLYSFQGGDDGAFPYGGLVSDQAGNFYGTTAESTGGGTVFKMSPPTTHGGNWTETVLYQFTGGADGGFPVGELIFDSAGNLYGVATAGGSAGGGAIFQVTPHGSTWTETVIYNFSVNASPVAGLVFDHAGNLYGAAFKGENGSGEIYQLAPSGSGWTYQVISSFGVGRHALVAPVAGPVLSKAGNLYGLVQSNGTNNFGGVYELKAPATQGGAWRQRLLYSFPGGNAGDGPTGQLLFGKNALYGVTDGAGYPGTVFQLTPQGTTWTETTLYTFCSQAHCSDGLGPVAGLLSDAKGNLYGTTYYGGKGSDLGTVYKLAPPAIQGGSWTESVLHQFSPKRGDGNYPRCRLVRGQFGVLLGTTVSGGSANSGTVFQVRP